MNRLDCSAIEWKFDPAGEAAQAMSFEGHGAVFGNVDSYGDVIAPGAFSKFLSDVQEKKADWPLMLSQHGGFGLTAEDMTPIGVWTDLAEDGKGLRIKGQLADTPRGVEVYKLMKMAPRPALDGMSIGYVAKKWEPRTKPEDPRRLLTEIHVIEVSVVSRPANRMARVDGVKTIEELTSIRDAEEYLRAQGMTKSAAVALISRIKAAAGDPRGNDGSGDPAVAELLAALKPIRERARA